MLTLIDLAEGSATKFLDNLEAAFQNFLSVLQHLVLFIFRSAWVWMSGG